MSIKIEADASDSLMLIKGTGLAYKVDGSAKERARSVRREMRIRRLSFRSMILVSIIGTGVCMVTGNMAIMSTALIGVITFGMYFVNPVTFGFCNNDPRGIERMDTFSREPRPVLMATISDETPLSEGAR